MRMRPRPISAWLSSPLVVRSLPSAEKPRVLLTFDDGPTAEVTDGVLERLAAARARAIFFVIGNRARKQPGLLARVQSAGHATGNHSHTHPTGRWPLPGPYWEDMERCNRIVEKATGKRPLFFRAPEGRLHAGSILGAKRLGLIHVLWSLDSQDWTCENPESARQAAERVLSQVRDGDIILMHEYAHWTWDLLDVLLPGLRERGYDLNSGLDDLT